MEEDNGVKALNRQIVILAVIIALMAGAFVMSYYFEYTQAKLAPLTVSLIVFLLSAAQLLKELRGDGKKNRGVQEEGGGRSTEQKLSAYVYESLWLGSFIIAIYLLGFYIAVPLFSLLYMLFHQAKWMTSMSVAVLTLLFIYIIFVRVLDFRLHNGLLLTVLGGA
jgi:hypothetical protein